MFNGLLMSNVKFPLYLININTVYVYTIFLVNVTVLVVTYLIKFIHLLNSASVLFRWSQWIVLCSYSAN